MSHPSITFTLVAPEPEAPSDGAVSAEGFGRMLRQLLPPGRLWREAFGAALTDLLDACGEELARVDARVRNLLSEKDPRNADELLPDFEADLDLESTGTTDERRARVVAHMIRRRRVRPIDFQEALAPLLGLDPEDVVVMETSRAQAIAMNDDREIYRFFIYRDVGLPGSYDLDAAQALVDVMAHSHTKGHVILSISFLCDDPDSLCDRDRLGV